MFGTYFYHEKTRKAVALFGRLFNNLYVMRTNSSGQVINQIKLPLAYAPKEKYLDRIRESTDLQNGGEIVAIKLPRASFEITGITYDTSRQLTKTSNFNQPGSTLLKRTKVYSPVPYTISFQLNIYAKSHDDSLQVVEQILPTFNPQYTLTIKPFPNKFPNFVEDIPIILTSVDFTDDYDGSMQSRRSIIYTLNFDMKVQYYGPVDNESAIINEVNTEFFFMEAGTDDSDISVQGMRVRADSSGAGIGVSPDSDYGFITDITPTYIDSN